MAWDPTLEEVSLHVQYWLYLSHPVLFDLVSCRFTHQCQVCARTVVLDYKGESVSSYRLINQPHFVDLNRYTVRKCHSCKSVANWFLGRQSVFQQWRSGYRARVVTSSWRYFLWHHFLLEFCRLGSGVHRKWHHRIGYVTGIAITGNDVMFTRHLLLFLLLLRGGPTYHTTSKC